MSDTKTTLTWLLRDQVSATAGKLDKALGKAETTAVGGKGAFGALGGALSSMINPTTLAIAGIGALTAGVGMALSKAAEHEVVLKRLDTTLASNAKGFDGNRDAIDKYIEKQTNAGFTVDETTASLAQLVTATGDVAKAQEFQQAAMDLARLKGISLADATDAMTKIEAGRFRGLANLGIVLEKGATVTDALTAVQRVAAGQSEAYGSTVQGAMSKINAKFDDAMTKIGEGLMPVLAALAGFFADVVIPVMERVIGVISRLIGWIADAVGWFRSLFESASSTSQVANQAAQSYWDPRQRRAAGGPVEPGGVYMVGEHGPETLVMGSRGGSIVPNGGWSGGGDSGVRLLGVSQQQIVEMVDRGLYFKLQRAAPTVGRT